MNPLACHDEGLEQDDGILTAVTARVDLTVVAEDDEGIFLQVELLENLSQERISTAG